MLTAQELKELKEELKQYGYFLDSVDLYKLIDLPSYQGHITLFYSVIDFTGRDDLAARTSLKFKSTLKALELIHKKAGKKLPIIKILLCDDLQRHNFPHLSDKELKEDLESKRAKLAEILGIPQITCNTGFISQEIEGQTYQFNIQRWDHLLTEEVQNFVKAVKEKLDKAAQDPMALQNFCNDSYLINATNGILRDEVATLKNLMMKQSGTTNIADRNLVGLGPNLTLAAIQFLKHTLKEKANLDISLDHKTDHSTYSAQKEVVLGHATFKGQGLSDFKNGIVYVMEEIFAFCNQPSIYIYGAGTVTMHASHPFYGMHHLNMAGKQPFGCLASAEFNDLTEAKLLQFRQNYEQSKQNQPRPKSKPIKIANPTTSHQNQDDNLTGSYDSDTNKGPSKSPSPSTNPSSGDPRKSVDSNGNNSDTDSSSRTSSGRNSPVNPFSLVMELLSGTSPEVQRHIIKDVKSHYQKKNSNKTIHNTSSSFTPIHNTGDHPISPHSDSTHATVFTQESSDQNDNCHGTRQPVIHSLSFSSPETTSTTIVAHPVSHLSQPAASPILTTTFLKITS